MYFQPQALQSEQDICFTPATADPALPLRAASSFLEEIAAKHRNDSFVKVVPKQLNHTCTEIFGSNENFHEWNQISKVHCFWRH